MTTYDFGDVVAVEYQFTDLTSSKARPAVVVSSSRYNAHRLDVVLMAVSSRLRPALLFGEVVIQDWKGAGLRAPSIVKPAFVTLEKALVQHRLGRLLEPDRTALQARVHDILSDA
jgi:mRNA interferase MazF